MTTSIGLAQKNRFSRAQELGISLIQTEACPRGRVLTLSLPHVLDQIGLNGVYCEGGLGLRNPFWKEGLADYLFRYQSPREFLGPRSVSSPIPKKLRLRDPMN